MLGILSIVVTITATISDATLIAGGVSSLAGLGTLIFKGLKRKEENEK